MGLGADHGCNSVLQRSLQSSSDTERAFVCNREKWGISSGPEDFERVNVPQGLPSPRFPCPVSVHSPAWLPSSLGPSPHRVLLTWQAALPCVPHSHFWFHLLASSPCFSAPFPPHPLCQCPPSPCPVPPPRSPRPQVGALSPPSPPSPAPPPTVGSLGRPVRSPPTVGSLGRPPGGRLRPPSSLG